MLTADERREIEHEAGLYPDRKAASIEALKVAARTSGWVSDESLREVALILGMTPADLDAVATFYNLIHRRPVGRHIIYVCDSVSCWILGCDGVFGALAARLGIQPGETTPDGRFTILPIPCLGCCDHGPALQIDGDLHRDVDPSKIDAVLEKYR